MARTNTRRTAAHSARSWARSGRSSNGSDKTHCHGLELDLATLVVTGPQLVTDPGGVLRLPIPAMRAVAPIWVQAFALSADPGYAPGSLSNAIRILD